MSSVAGASSMSMASLYAMLGLAMPSGMAATSAGSSPALAMMSAANESVSSEIGTLLGSLPSAGASQTSLTQALMSLAYLDPSTELARLQGAVQADMPTPSG
jgi:hypothetical protein